MVWNWDKHLVESLVVASFAELSASHLTYMLMFGAEELAGAVETIILQMQTFQLEGEEIEEVLLWQSCPLGKAEVAMGNFSCECFSLNKQWIAGKEPTVVACVRV